MTAPRKDMLILIYGHSNLSRPPRRWFRRGCLAAISATPADPWCHRRCHHRHSARAPVSMPLRSGRAHLIARAGIGPTFQTVRVFGELPVQDNLRVADHLATTPGQTNFAERLCPQPGQPEGRRHRPLLHPPDRPECTDRGYCRRHVPPRGSGQGAGDRPFRSG